MDLTAYFLELAISRWQSEEIKLKSNQKKYFDHSLFTVFIAHLLSLLYVGLDDDASICIQFTN